MLSIAYETFFAVASHKSFSKAAEAMFISQPAVSKQIKKLESDLGIALIERKGNTIQLTSSGDSLFDYLHKAKQIQTQMQSDIAVIKNQQRSRGELKIGASTTISLYVMPQIFSVFRRKFPEVKLLLINRNSENILKALVDREIDLAIVEGHYESNALRYEPFMDDEVVPVCSRHSPYGRMEFEPKDITTVPVSLRERGSGTQSVLKKSLEAHGVKMGDLNIVARLGGTEALKNFLVADDSIGFLSRLAVAKELQSGVLKEVKVKSWQIDRKFEFVLRKGEESSGITRSFIKEAKTIITSSYNS